MDLVKYFLSQGETPLLAALQECTRKKLGNFFTPGHKQGKGINPNLQKLLGKKLFLADLPELPELDNLFAPENAIAKAQQLAAICFGADRTWFLVNGSTCGIIAAIASSCGEGEKIILPRNIHISAISGLILSGAIPIFIDPQYDPVKDVVCSISSKCLKKTLQKHPSTKAVLILHPSYQGICGDLKAIADITHSYNIPLIVDEAHGGHFGFHQGLPPSALSVGADLTVQSTHKVLGAMTQASMLHIQGNRIDADRVSKALQLVESTSPNYLLLASLDAARQQMALYGEELMGKTLELASLARKELGKIEGIDLLALGDREGFLDPTRLTIFTEELGISGYEIDEILHSQLGVTCELPLLKHLTFILTFGNSVEDIEMLVSAFKFLSESYFKKKIKSNLPKVSSFMGDRVMAISPRKAYFSSTKTIPFEKSRHRISGELICPYPPGIPVLIPGEFITESAIDYLQSILRSGAIITGCKDSSLNNINVVL